MPLVLGLDCGGSSTRALVVDQTGETVFEGRSGPANLASTPEESLRRHLAEALQDAPEVQAVAACFAGLLTPSDALRAKTYLEPLVQTTNLHIYVDYHAALAADPAAHTIMISGTGCIVVSHDPRHPGKFVKSAGGGPLVGDEGSVFDLGRLALQNSLLAGREKEPSDAFRQSLADQFGGTGRDHVLAALYQSPSPAAKVAKLAPAVVLDYHRRIPYAVESVQTLERRLKENLARHAQAFGPFPEPWNVRLTGGLWDIEPEFFEKLVSDQSGALQGTLDMDIAVLQIPPVHGAVNLAKRHLL